MELSFTIAVNGMPSFGDEVVDNQSYEVEEGVELPVTLPLPEAVGGNVALTYFLDGKLPPGLAFNPTAWTISGELSPNVEYSPEPYALTYRVGGYRWRCSGVELHDCGECYALL